MHRRIYRTGSTFFEIVSVLLMSASMNVLTSLMPSAMHGSNDFIAPSGRFSARLVLALTAMIGGIVTFRVGRLVKKVEEYDHARLRAQRSEERRVGKER